jgi:hypothetical protein
MIRLLTFASALLALSLILGRNRNGHRRDLLVKSTIDTSKERVSYYNTIGHGVTQRPVGIEPLVTDANINS